MKYQWESCPNPQVNIMHVSVRLPRSFEGYPDDSCDREDRDFVSSLNQVDGVENVITDGYECQVEKAKLFAWAPIHRDIVEVFRQRYKPNGKLTAVKSAGERTRPASMN